MRIMKDNGKKDGSIIQMVANEKSSLNKNIRFIYTYPVAKRACILRTGQEYLKAGAQILCPLRFIEPEIAEQVFNGLKNGNLFLKDCTDYFIDKEMAEFAIMDGF